MLSIESVLLSKLSIMMTMDCFHEIIDMMDGTISTVYSGNYNFYKTLILSLILSEVATTESFHNTCYC